MRTVLLNALICLSFVQSCNDEEYVNPTIVGQWIRTAATISPPYNGKVSDIYHDLLDECDRDNIMEYKTDSTYIYHEGKIRCNPPSLDQTGTYYTKESNTILVHNGNDTFSLALKGNSMVIWHSFTDAGTTYTETHTYSRHK